jgi:AraC-like DNA-binding protein
LLHFDKGAYPAGLKHDWHAHNEIHFQVCISGLFDVGTKAGDQILKPGHIWLIGPGIEHYWICRQRGILMGVHIQITGPSTQQIRSMIEQTWGNNLLVLKQNYHRTDLEELLRTVDRSDLWWIDRAAMSFKGWVMKLLEETLPLNPFYRNLPAKEALSDDHTERYCRLACDYMRYNLHRKIRLIDVASHLGISIRHLNRIFRTHVNTTCNNWLIEQRMQKARGLLLANPNMPVKTVAYNCGFDKPAYFSKVFKEYWGDMPSQSR